MEYDHDKEVILLFVMVIFFPFFLTIFIAGAIGQAGTSYMNALSCNGVSQNETDNLAGISTEAYLQQIMNGKVGIRNISDVKLPSVESDEVKSSPWWISVPVNVPYILSENGIGEKAVATAYSRLGDPYSMALRGLDNYVDCSYLVYWTYKQLGVELPLTAAEQGRYIVNHQLMVSKENLLPGDLIFWSFKPNMRFMNITHVGIYAGEGMVIDASSTYKKVVYRSLFSEDKQVLYGRIFLSDIEGEVKPDSDETRQESNSGMAESQK